MLGVYSGVYNSPLRWSVNLRVFDQIRLGAWWLKESQPTRESDTKLKASKPSFSSVLFLNSSLLLPNIDWCYRILGTRKEPTLLRTCLPRGFVRSEAPPPSSHCPFGAESLTDLFVVREQKAWVRAWCRAPSHFGQAVTRGIASAFYRGWR